MKKSMLKKSSIKKSSIKKSSKKKINIIPKDRQSLFYAAQARGILVFIALFFYRSLLAVLFLLPMLWPICRRCRKRAAEKKNKEMTEQFKEAMNSILTSLKAGYSPENAFRECVPEMAFLFGKRSMICREMTQICKGMDNHIALEKLLLEFGSRSRIPDIQEFAQVFSIAKRGGGKMTEILERTIALLQDRMETEKEINLMISAKKMEQRIMDAVPFLIVFYVGITSRGFFDSLYHNPKGILIMTICLAVYIAAFAWSEKIVEIQL